MGQARLTNTNHYEDWPPFIRQASDQAALNSPTSWAATVIRMDGAKSHAQLEKLTSSSIITQIVDNYDEQLAELYTSENAQLYKANPQVKATSIRDFLATHYAGKPAWTKGSWVYYPWDGRLVHVLEEALFTRLRTVRNQYLITAQEQLSYADFRVGCAGMSVGSNGAMAIALTGGARRIKLADGAVLSGSNLNRLRSGVASVGLNKCVVIARQIHELNPYTEIDITSTNLSKDNLDRFFVEPWPLQLVVDEIDDIEMKIRLRMEAKKRRLPVIMITEPGDDLILDVERFDLNPDLPLFHGLAGDIEDVMQRKSLTQREYVKYALMIIGVENMSIRAQKAMLKIGSTLPSPPQLGSTAMMAGGVIAYAARQIAIGARLKSGRHVLSFDREFMQGANSLEQKIKHYRSTQSLKRATKLM